MTTVDGILGLVTHTFEEASQAGLLVEYIVLRLLIAAKLNGADLFHTEVHVLSRARLSLVSKHACHLYFFDRVCNCHPPGVWQRGYPQLSMHAKLVPGIKFEDIRERRNIPGALPGSALRNFCNYDLAAVCNEGISGQVTMEPWVAHALRWAYPFGHYAGYPAEFPSDLEKSLSAAIALPGFSADELVHWCRLIMGEPTLPAITATLLPRK